VVRSACVGRVGIRGIVVKDARFVFELVTRGDRLKVVPKEGTVFRVEIAAAEGESATDGGRDGAQAGGGQRNMVFEIHGGQFAYRSADRANKKFKTHFLENI